MPSAVKTTSKRPASTVAADVNFINDITIKEFDTVHLSIELYTKLFPNPDDPNSDPTSKFVLVKLLGAPDYFKTYKILKVTSIDHFNKTPLSVTFVNHTNLLKFDNQITLNRCLIKPVAPGSIISLDKIMVSAPPNVYEILANRDHEDIKRMFINQFLAHNDSIVSMGDIIRDINAVVKLCEPVTQGLVGTNTSIILVKDHQPEEFHSNGTIQNDATLPSNRLSDDPIESDYIDSSDGETETDITLDLSEYFTTKTSFSSQFVPTNFTVKPLEHCLSTSQAGLSHLKEDNDLYVFLNVSDLARLKFSVFNGDAVNLSCDNGKSSVVVKIWTVMEPNRTFKPGNVYLSPVLIVNLGLTKDSIVQFSPIDNAKRSLPLSKVLPVAKSVTISRVASPITMDKTYQRSFFAALKTSFHSSLKSVRIGDYIPVTLDSVLSKTMFETFNSFQQEGQQELEDLVVPSGDPDVVAWFKISDVQGDDQGNSNQYIIDPNKTRMISSGVDYVMLPENGFAQWSKYLGLPQVFPYSKAIENDPTIFKYASELNKILKTCISTSGKVNLKTSILLNSMNRGLGKTTLVRETCLSLGLNLIELDVFELINPGAELKTIGLIRGKIDKLISDSTGENYFHVIYLKHIENLCIKTNENEQGSGMNTSLSLKILQLLQEYLDTYSRLVIILSCNDIDKLNENVRSMIKFQIDLGVPNENERLEIFKFLIQQEIYQNASIDQDIEDSEDEDSDDGELCDLTFVPFGRRNDVSFKSLALQSAGLTPRDLISIIKNAKRLALERIKEIKIEKGVSLKELLYVGNGGYINWIPEDFNKSINEARNQFSDSIGAPRIPNVKWEDIGGLDLVKDEILDTIDMPLKHPELFNNGLKKRSGILFYGPPGTGKTLLAKAIATNFSLNFFSVKGPELLNMYIGESEANVRRVFQKARDAKPCVIFFDELDSVAPKRGNQGDSGGVMDRIVSQLLAELDGMSGGEGGGDGVFVVGATNRPDLLDEALLRPGRFDKMLYLGISDTDEKQAKILEALTRKFQLADDVDLNVIAHNCSFTFTGADFYALCSDSMLNAMTRTAHEVDLKIKKYNSELEKEGKPPKSTRWWFDNIATKEDVNVLVSMGDFEKAQSELTPSVSAEELEHYLKVRENFEGGKEKAKQVTGDKAKEPPVQKAISVPSKEDLIKKVHDLVGENVTEIVDSNGNQISQH